MHIHWFYAGVIRVRVSGSLNSLKPAGTCAPYHVVAPARLLLYAICPSVKLGTQLKTSTTQQTRHTNCWWFRGRKIYLYLYMLTQHHDRDEHSGVDTIRWHCVTGYNLSLRTNSFLYFMDGVSYEDTTMSEFLVAIPAVYHPRASRHRAYQWRAEAAQKGVRSYLERVHYSFVSSFSEG